MVCPKFALTMSTSISEGEILTGKPVTNYMKKRPDGMTFELSLGKEDS